MATIAAVALLTGTVLLVSGVLDPQGSVTTDGGAPSGEPTAVAPVPEDPASPVDPGQTLAPGPSATAGPPATSEATPFEQPPREPEETATTAQELTIRITEQEAVGGVATAPGEVAAPALRVGLTIRNAGPAPVDLSAVLVNAFYGPEQTPASTLLEPGGVPLPEAVAPGEEVVGVYLFTIPEQGRSDSRLVVELGGSEPAVVFTGELG